jgi:hypothetical protein
MALMRRLWSSASSEKVSATSMSTVSDRCPGVGLGVDLVTVLEIDLGVVLGLGLVVGLRVGPGLTLVPPWVPFWVVSVVIRGHRMLYPCTCKGGNGYCQQACVCVTLLSTPNGKGTARHA